MMRALTIVHPWADAIAHGPKRVENRTWVPGRTQLVSGDTFAIHAGARYDHDGRQFIMKQIDVRMVLPDARSAVVAVATFGGWDEPRNADDVWAFGPCCWILRDVRTLRTPVRCPGRQGLWVLPADVERKVRAEVAGG